MIIQSSIITNARATLPLRLPCLLLLSVLLLPLKGHLLADTIAPYGWGTNRYGELGGGNINFPANTVPAPLTTAGTPLAGKTITAMALGQYHTLVLCSDGTLVSSGHNSDGQLGDNSTTDRTTFATVTTAGTALAGKTVVAIAAGTAHSLALCSDGTLAAWGLNANGQLGDGTTTSHALPVAVSTAGTALEGRTVTAIAAGDHHSLVLCSDNGLTSWGGNLNGELGRAGISGSSVPVNIPYPGTPLWGRTVTAIASGYVGTLVLCSDSTLVKWGWGVYVPVVVDTSGSPLAGKTVAAIAAGYSHYLALSSEGKVYSWGSNSYGQIGDNTTTTRTAPVLTAATALQGKTVTAIGAGGYHSAALCSDGSMATWGFSGNGELGDGSNTSISAPVQVNLSNLPVGSRFNSLFCGGNLAWRTMAVMSIPSVVSTPTMAVKGNSATISAGDTSPSTADATDFGYVAVAGGTATSTFTIANTGNAALNLTGSPKVAVSGANAAQFIVTAQPNSPVAAITGTATFTITFAPTASATALRTATVSIANNDATKSPYTFAIQGTLGSPTLASGSVVAWGNNVFGQTTGTPTTSSPYAAVANPVAGLSGVTAVAAGFSHTVALKYDGTVTAQGFNTNGQTSVPAGLTGVIAIAAGDYHTVALKNDGTVVAWGHNGSGQTTGTPTASSPYAATANPVPGLSGVIAIAAGHNHTVALKNDGTVVGWGDNAYGKAIHSALQGGVRAIAAGGNHTLVLINDGTVVAWGNNTWGQVTGTPSSIDTATAAPVTLNRVVLRGIVAIAAGGDHSLALKDNGEVVAWGDSSNLQNDVPVMAKSGVTAIAASDGRSVALKADGTVVAWGSNSFGEVTGTPRFGDSTATPVMLSGTTILKGVTAIAAGGSHTVAVINDTTSLLTLHRADPASALVNAVPGAAIDEALIPTSSTTDLKASCTTAISGLVCDGVTPLLFKLRNRSMTTYSSYVVTASVVSGGSVTGGLAEHVRGLTSSGHWRLAGSDGTAPLYVPPPASGQATSESYGYINAIPAESLVLDSGSKEVRCLLSAQQRDALGANVGPPVTTSFYLRKPPIALVHGFNTLGAWGDAFKDKLSPGGHSDPFVVQIQYGVLEGDDTQEESARTYPNTYFALPYLADQLSRQLKLRIEDPSAPLHSQWAYTRYDVVGHSQGGVLARMLSSEAGPGVPAFRNKANGYQGRFRRIITIGSPHNGSRLIRYLLQWKAKGAVLPAELGNMGLVQEKFDPWGEQIQDLNKPGGRWVPDPHAKFLMIRSTINDGDAPSLTDGIRAHELMLLGSTRGPVVLPHGSDGAVDLDSQGYVAPGAINNVFTVPESTNIAHADPRLPVSLFGTNEFHVSSGTIADVVRMTLYDPARFGPFSMPPLLINTGSEGKTALDAMVPDSSKAGRAISRLIPGAAPAPERLTASKTSAPAPASLASYQFQLTPPDGQAPVGDVEWSVEVFGPNGVTQDGVTLTVDPLDSLKVTVAVDASVLGDVVLYARYPTATGIAYADPIKVVTVAPAGATLAALSLLPATTAVPAGTSLPLELWATYSDDTKLRVYVGGDEVALTSLNTTIADVAPTGVVTLKAKGTASIQAAYHGLVAVSQITVSSGAAPFVAAVPNLTATQGKPFQYQFKASDEPTHFGATGLPPGLTMNDTTGLLSGTPTVSGVFTLGVAAGNAAGIGASREVLLTVAAGVGGAEIAVEQPVGINVVDGGIADFGNLYMGGSASMSFLLRNQGSGDLVIAGMELSGLNAADFTVTTAPAGTIKGPKGSTTVTLSFTPGALGKRTAALQVFSNDSDESPFDIRLQGMGIDADTNTVVAWGIAQFGQTSVPGGLSGVTAISTGGSHAMALKTDGTVVAWGDNGSGQATVPSGLVGVTAIASGGAHSLALMNDGTVRAWGGNTYGQTTVPAGLIGVVAVAAGGLHSLALKGDGSVMAWGFNAHGQATVPVAAKSGVVAVCCGFDHNAAVKADGTVIAWGNNEYGKATVPAGLQGVTAITAGDYHTVALKSDGTVIAWGRDLVGMTTVPANLTDVRAISAADFHTLALKGDGTIVGWGGNDWGQCTAPAAAQGSALAISAGGAAGLAIVGIAPASSPRFVMQFGGGTLVSGKGTASGGSVPLGQSADLTFTIRNSGTASLTDLGISVDGLNQSDFTVTAAPAASLAASGGSTTFTVQFTPTARGTRTAMLHITSNDIYNSPFDVTLTGNCVTPEIVVEQPAGTGLLDGAGSVNFGTLKSSASASLLFTLKNKGTATLNGLALSMDGAQASDFVFSSLAVTTLAPNASTTFNVTFSPGATGLRTAALHVASDDVDESSFDIALTGTGAGTPGITPQPVSQLLAVGEAASFTSGATGGGLSLQWLKNGVAIAQATGTTYSTTATLASAGNYSLKATNIVGTATSTAAKLGVVSQAESDVLVNEGGTLTLIAPAAAPAGTTFTYQWSHDGNTLADGGAGPGDIVSGATKGTLKITKATTDIQGGYTCVIGMGGLTKTCGAFNVLLRYAPTVDATGPFAWIVSGTVEDVITAQDHPTTFTFKNLPLGVVGNSSNGQLSGKPIAATTTDQTFTVTASNPAGSSVPVAFTYTVEALPDGYAGTYNGLLDRDTTLSAPIATPPGQTLQGHGGSLANLIVTSTGSITGKLNLEDKTYLLPPAARLDIIKGYPSASATIPIVRGTSTDNIPDLVLELGFDPEGEYAVGTLTDNLPSSVPIKVLAWRNPWKAGATATALAGSYTAGLEPDSALIGYHEHPDIPQGNGYITMSVTAEGVATWGGKLADGTGIAGSSTLNKDGVIPTHMMLYTPTVAATAGSAQGWLWVRAGFDTSTVKDNDLFDTGDFVAPNFDWMKRAQAPASTTRSYKNGIPLHKLKIVGGGFVAPDANTPVLGLIDGGSGTKNARLVFTEGDIFHSSLAGPGSPAGSLTGTLNQAFRISNANVVTMPTGAFSNPGSATLKLDPKTGAISGTFTLIDNDPTDLVAPIAVVTRTVPWAGVLLPYLGNGVGQFQLPQLPANGPPKTTSTTSPQLSGQVVLEPNE